MTTMIRTCFSTLGCPDWGWRDLLTFGPRFGYDGVEIRLLERDTELLERPEFQSGELPARRRETADAGFQVCGLASSVRFDDVDEAERSRQVDVGKAYLELAAELGAAFVRVFGDVLSVSATGGQGWTEERAPRSSARRGFVKTPAPATADRERNRSIGRIAEGLQRLGEFAQPLGITVVIETHGDFSDSRLMQETLQRVESPAVGVLWDTHHPWRFCGEELDATFERLQPWVRHTHWKDSVSNSRRASEGETADEAARQAHALMSGHRHANYVLFGGGEFPALQCARLLRNAGYDGWLSLEWEKMWHPEIESPKVALPLFPGKMRTLWELAGGS